MASGGLTAGGAETPCRQPATHAMRGLAIRLWTGWWWLLRAHVAACYMIPRSSLENPPEPWMRVMLDAPRRDAVVPATRRPL